MPLLRKLSLLAFVGPTLAGHSTLFLNRGELLLRPLGVNDLLWLRRRRNASFLVGQQMDTVESLKKMAIIVAAVIHHVIIIFFFGLLECLKFGKGVGKKLACWATFWHRHRHRHRHRNLWVGKEVLGKSRRSKRSWKVLKEVGKRSWKVSNFFFQLL